jgi:hypothetical protein
MLEELKKHWLISHTLVAVAAAGMTWGALEKVIVGPREFAIGQLQRDILELRSQIDTLKAEAQQVKSAAGPAREAYQPRLVYEDSVDKGNSATTKDGRLIVRITTVIGESIWLTTALGSGQPVEHKIRVGERVSVDDASRIYYVDTWRVRAETVDLKVFVEPK